MRFCAWSNTLGIVLLAMTYMFFHPWFNNEILNGTSSICVLDARVQSTPVGLPALKSWEGKSFRLADRPCAEVKDLDAVEASFIAYMRGREFKNPSRNVIAVEKDQTRTGKRANPSPTWSGYVEAFVRSLLALFLGGVAIRLIHPLYVRFLGRLSDPMWIPK